MSTTSVLDQTTKEPPNLMTSRGFKSLLLGHELQHRGETLSAHAIRAAGSVAEKDLPATSTTRGWCEIDFGGGNQARAGRSMEKVRTARPSPVATAGSTSVICKGSTRGYRRAGGGGGQRSTKDRGTGETRNGHGWSVKRMDAITYSTPGKVAVEIFDLTVWLHHNCRNPPTLVASRMLRRCG